MTERPRSRTGSAEPAPRHNRPRAVADLLPAIGGAAFRKFGFVQSAIVSRWPEIVGERYAGVSSPESLRFPPGKRSDGVLSLMVESAHAPMMQHVSGSVVERVNRFFGYPAVAKVTIRQGAARRREPARAVAPQPAPVPVELGDSLRTIADPELRACLEALAIGVAGKASAAGPGPKLIGKVR